MDKNKTLHQDVLIENVSGFDVGLVKFGENKVSLLIKPGEKYQMVVKEGDCFYSLKYGKGKPPIKIATIPGVFRRASDTAGLNHVGALYQSTPKLGEKFKIQIGRPVFYRDDRLFSLKSATRSYTGGTPWVDLVNNTTVPLTFQDGLSPTTYRNWTILPGETFRYSGRYQWGVNYGTYIKNLDGIFQTVQITSPITHLIYGVL